MLFYTGIRRSASDVLADRDRAATVAGAPARARRATSTRSRQLGRDDGRRPRSAATSHAFGVAAHRAMGAEVRALAHAGARQVDGWIRAGIDAGAAGGKLVGAGDGGFLLFYAEAKARSARRDGTSSGSTRCASGSTTSGPPSSSPSDAVPGRGPRRRARAPGSGTVTGERAPEGAGAGRRPPVHRSQARRASRTRGVERGAPARRARRASTIRDHVGERLGLRAAGRVPRGRSDAARHRRGASLARCPRLGDAFWVTYGDTLLDVDLAAAEAAVHDRGMPRALMTVLHNRDRWQPSNALVRDGRVVAYAKNPAPAGAEHIDYGMLAVPSPMPSEEWRPPRRSIWAPCSGDWLRMDG